MGGPTKHPFPVPNGKESGIRIDSSREAENPGRGIVHYVLSHDKTIPSHPGVGRKETAAKEPRGGGIWRKGKEEKDEVLASPGKEISRASQMTQDLLGHLSAGGQEGSNENIPPSCRPGQKTAPPPLRRGMTRQGQGGLHGGRKTRCDAGIPPPGEPQEL